VREFRESRSFVIAIHHGGVSNVVLHDPMKCEAVSFRLRQQSVVHVYRQGHEWGRLKLVEPPARQLVADKFTARGLVKFLYELAALRLETFWKLHEVAEKALCKSDFHCSGAA
jgi:hypothetical protein